MTKTETTTKPFETLPPVPATTTELRSYLKANGVSYSGNDRKADLVAKAEAFRSQLYPLVTLASEDPEFLAALADEEEIEAWHEETLAAASGYTGPRCRDCSTADAGPDGLNVEADGTFQCLPCADKEFAAVEVSLPVEAPAADRIERTRLAKEEFKVLKSWLSNLVGERPSTVNLDAVNISYERTGDSHKSTSTRRPSTTIPMNYLRNGVQMPPASNKFSCLAYQCTKNVEEGSPRISASTLRDLLAASGIDEPTSTAWTFTLSNGVTIGGQPA